MVRRRYVVLVAALATALVGGLPAAAQDESGQLSRTVERSEYNSYVVVMKAEPLVATEGRNLNTSQARARAQQLRASHRATLSEAGLGAGRLVNEYVTALNGFSARVNHRQALQLANDKDVALVLPDVLRQPQTDSSGEFLGLNASGGAYPSGVTGKGVVVGIIDTGIWPEHPSFADNGLPAPRGVAAGIPCEFGNTGTVAGHNNPNDAPFTCQDKLIGARQTLESYRSIIGADPSEFDSARDDNGHGTHTASTAAGNAGVSATILGSPVGDGPISGIAPDAHIIAYKGLGNLGGFTSDLAGAIDQAVEDGVDVINYSIGGGGGVLGADDIAFLFAADAGVFTAASAGNSGPGAQTVGSPGDDPWVTGVGASTQSRFLSGTIELGNGATYTGASVTDGVGPVGIVDAANAAPGPDGDLCISTAKGSSKLNATVKGKIVLCRRGVNARADKSLAVLQAGGVGMIMYEQNDVGNLFTDNHHVPTVHIDNTPGLAIKAYIASAGNAATAEIRDTRSIGTWPNAPTTTSFSSRGPSSYADVIKPDVTAPGLQILAGNSPFPDEAGTVTGELFQAIAGTSMSSPHVAGLFALLKQAHPDWSAAAAKSALMTTANTNVLDNNRTSAADPFDMGSGHVRPGRVGGDGSSFRPGLVYDAGLRDYAAWTCAMNAGVFTDATCDFLVDEGYSMDPSDLNYPSIAVAELPGSQTVTRRVTNVSGKLLTFTAGVDAPNGYSVTVSPSQLKVPPGQTREFQVTIVNNSAPIDAWRFGSMTWTSGQFKVRSPIAVKGSAFNAPPLVDGSGVSGSASFDIKFGYTGQYQATAHGLVPATVTHDNVLQDPDQEFDPADGFSNDHAFNLSGAAVFRIAMPPEATEAEADMDIFVYNPSGQQVASSTAGGTDELITINNPADGTWHVWVHGWAAPGGDSDYDLFTWAISATPGGSMSITSAPSSATNGSTGTVSVGWTGATAGQWHFGAVTHRGAGGALMGRTLVQVDNR